MQTEHRLTKRNLWSYTVAGIGRDMAGSLFFSFMLTFVLFTKNLTDLQFTFVSTIIVLARIFDAFNDPIMGNILEVTRTKWGKFKPWIAIGMVLSAVVFYVSFSTTLEGWSYVALFAGMYFAYSIVFTMNDIAYWGMLPSLARDKKDRDLLTARAVLFAGIGGGIASVAVPTFTIGDLAIGGNALTAYSRLSLIFCVFFIGMQSITLFGVKEKPLPPKGAATVNKVGVGTILNVMRNNDQLVWIMLVFILNQIGGQLFNGGLGANYLYFEFDYNGMLPTIFAALGAVATGLVMLFFAPISRRFKRNQLMRVAALSAIGGFVFMLIAGLILPSGSNIKLIMMVLCNLFAFGGSGVYYLVLMICIANTVEYNEWKTGARAEGIIFSVRPFLTKMGFAIIQLMTMVILLLSGVRQYTNRISDFENMTNRGLLDADSKLAQIRAVLAGVPEGKNAALLACLTLIPLFFMAASYYVYHKKYTITEEKYDQILLEINERREIIEAAEPI